MTAVRDLLPTAEDLPALAGLAALSLSLALWGIGWGLPSRERTARVLPPEALGPAAQEKLASSWQAMHSRQGPEPLLNAEHWSAGFELLSTVPPGWTFPPDQLLNPARSFYLRSGAEDDAPTLVGLSRIRPDRLEFNPKVYSYGGLWFYSMGAWMAAVAAVSPLTLSGSVAFYLANPDKAAWLHLAGRLFSAAHFILGALLVYLIGRSLFGRETGFWAGLFFAVSPSIVLQAHTIKPHMLGAVCVMGVFYFCAKAIREGGRGTWLGAGIMVGAAAGSAPYLSLSSGLVAAAFLLRLRGQGRSALSEWRHVAAAGAASLVVFCATNPFFVYAPATSWPALKRIGQASPALNLAYLWIFPVNGFVKSVGLPTALLVLCGLADRRNLSEPMRRWTACAFLYYLGMTWFMQTADSMVGGRNFPAFFAGFLLAGDAVARWSRASSGPRRWVGRGVGLAAALYACLVCLVIDQNLHLDAARRSNQWAAGDWIEANIPAGSEIGFQRLPQPSTSPFFQWARYRLKFFDMTRVRELPPREFPPYLVLVSSASDETRRVPSLPVRYVPIRSFDHFGLSGLRLPTGSIYGNPRIDIYRRAD